MRPPGTTADGRFMRVDFSAPKVSMYQACSASGSADFRWKWWNSIGSAIPGSERNSTSTPSGQLADHETQASVLRGDARAIVDELLLVEREVLHRESDVIDHGAAGARGRCLLRERDVDAGEPERLQPAARDLLRAEREPDRLRFRDVRHREMNVTGRDTGRRCPAESCATAGPPARSSRAARMEGSSFM